MESSKKIEAQIFVLEKKLKTIKEGVPKYFSLCGKIKKLKKLLEESKHFEFLAK